MLNITNIRDFRGLLGIACLALLVAVSGCRFIYKVDIQQGNLLDQRLVDDLRPGMTKRQVALVLGTPAVESPFRHDRWDYISTYHRRGKRVTRKLLSLTFEDNRLIKIEGNYLPEDSEVVGDDKPAETDTG